MTDTNIWLPQGLPCACALWAKTFLPAQWRECEVAHRVLLLNLMPQKEVTETDIARTLAACGVDVQVLLMKIAGQTYKTTPAEHMQKFYLDFEDYQPFHFDHLIITGAPLEQIPFEQVRYWDQLCAIMDWAETHVAHTLYICWGAQAGLYKHYGIPKYALPEKMFGIFPQQVLEPSSPLMDGLTPSFLMPNSRHTEVRETDIAEHVADGLHIIASSQESGVGVVATTDLRKVFIVGHLEYEPLTLHNEYHRDLAKNLPIQAPVHYYCPDGTVDYSWHKDAVQFYANWLGLDEKNDESRCSKFTL